MYDKIFMQRRRDGQGVFSVLYGKAESLPWALTVPGAEHRFTTCCEALDFAKNSGWIDDSERRLILILLFTFVTARRDNLNNQQSA